MGFKDQRNTSIQSGLNQFGCGLKVDGDMGPRSLLSLEAYEKMCTSPLTYVMESALCGGKCSGFGGPTDVGDRVYGQAYLPYVDITKTTPKQYFEQYGETLPKDQDGKYLLNKAAMLAATEWPWTTGPDGRARANLSFFLTDDALRVALRVNGKEVRRLTSPTKLLRVMVINQETGAACIALLCDYGPHTKTGRNIDLSFGVMDKIGVVTDNKVLFYLLQD